MNTDDRATEAQEWELFLAEEDEDRKLQTHMEEKLNEEQSSCPHDCDWVSTDEFGWTQFCTNCGKDMTDKVDRYMFDKNDNPIKVN